MDLGNCPLEVAEKFLQHILLFEQSQDTQLFDCLIEGGLDLPPPEDLNDSQLNQKLWALIQAMSLHHVYLYCTDHLSDRALYELLWHDLLREEGFVPLVNGEGAYHLDILGSGSDEDVLTYLKYYADEKERKDWIQEGKKMAIPKMEQPPYNRDCHLPQWQPMEEESVSLQD